jgi:hypothetical protein
MVSKHDYHWTFGNSCHIQFPNGGSPVNAGPQSFSTQEGCATISDASGQLLFYTDGQKLWDSANASVPVLLSVGGNLTSTHSAIIVPPAGGGSRYHIFAVDSWEAPGSARPVTHTLVTVAGSAVSVQLSSGPAALPIGPVRAAERLAAISHKDCSKYWVIALNIDAALGTLHALRVDGDAQPTVTVTTPYPWPGVSHQYCVKFSRDGTLFAVVTPGTIDILNFDRATGLFTPHSQIIGFTKTKNRPYGVEFSPNGKYLYFTDQLAGNVRRHVIGTAPTAALGTTDIVSLWTPTGTSYRIGALQLGPNGKIYGPKAGTNTLFEISDPDNSISAATPASVQFKSDALAAGGAVLNLNATAMFGLPTVTIVTGDCDDRCRKLATEVDAILTERARLQNSMAHCCDKQPGEPQCKPLEIPPLQPQTYIHWGNSRCDCIEGDDTEIMYLTICNPYSNLTLSNLTVHELVVVDDQGNAVPNLPDGTPSIQLVPIGPYCFDDIAPCSCVSREFLLRLRGAPGNRKYRILVRGICFDACFHGDTEACFTFDVCKD